MPLSKALATRIASGLVLAPVVAFCILYNKTTFGVLMAIAFIISAREWLTMARAAHHRYLYTIIGLIYLLATFGAFIALRVTPHGRGPALTALLVVWASDTGAYFIGKRVGGAKLAPAISPNKTWAGFIGAMIFPGLLLLILIICDHANRSYFGTLVPFDILHLGLIFAAGCVLGAAGQAGDLFVSWFKRKGGLKDTGHLIPGHGGLLDRIDSLLLVAPFFLIFTWLLRA